MRYDIQDCKLGDMAKGYKFSLNKRLKNYFEEKEMREISYASPVASLIDA